MRQCTTSSPLSGDIGVLTSSARVSGSSDYYRSAFERLFYGLPFGRELALQSLRRCTAGWGRRQTRVVWGYFGRLCLDCFAVPRGPFFQGTRAATSALDRRLGATCVQLGDGREIRPSNAKVSYRRSVASGRSGSSASATMFDAATCRRVRCRRGSRRVHVALHTWLRALHRFKPPRQRRDGPRAGRQRGFSSATSRRSKRSTPEGRQRTMRS